MSTRSHWTEVSSLSVFTLPANTVPNVADDPGTEDVLVISDGGNQEAWVLEGTVEDWEQLAGLIKARCAQYRRGIGATP